MLPVRPTKSSPPESSSTSPQDSPGRDYLQDPLQLGITIVGTTAVIGGAGWWLDSRIGTFPIFMALGAVIGLFGILYVTILRLRESDKSPPDKDDRQRRSPS